MWLMSNWPSAEIMWRDDNEGSGLTEAYVAWGRDSGRERRDHTAYHELDLLPDSWSRFVEFIYYFFSYFASGREERGEDFAHRLVFRDANRKVAGPMPTWSESWVITIAPLTNALNLILLQGDFCFMVSFCGDIVCNMWKFHWPCSCGHK